MGIQDHRKIVNFRNWLRSRSMRSGSIIKGREQTLEIIKVILRGVQAPRSGLV